MMIKVGYQSTATARDPYSHFSALLYIECEKLPEKSAVYEKLKSTGRDVDENSLLFEETNKDPTKLRATGFTVLKM